MEQSTFLLTLLFTGIAFLVTSLGAFTVIFFGKIGPRLMAALLGFGGGVMIASSVWSMLLPAIEGTRDLAEYLLFVALGFCLGGGIIMLGDWFLQRQTERGKNRLGSIRSASLITFAVTIHNIPEGLCMGVAFGASLSGDPASLTGAMALAVSVALQNFPEGAAVSLPLYSAGLSKKKAFLLGSLSGLAEPLFGIVGFFLALSMHGLLPFLLSLSAGAMIITTVRELIPEAGELDKNFATLGLTVGFLLMMSLDSLL